MLQPEKGVWWHRPGKTAVTQMGRSHKCHQVLGSSDVGEHVPSASSFLRLGSGGWAAETC